ncbi:MAG: hypothetical protein KDC52_18870 [Ignavibacteriae bacterium]|nr:hypothetical protein [Ignavibacteriota bacterium]
MKYLFLIMILCGNSIIFSQSVDENYMTDSTAQRYSEGLVSGGVSINPFEFGLLRLSYLYNLDKNFTFPFELEYFFGYPIGSISVRFQQTLNEISKFYLQSGVGLIIGGVESIGFFPNYNLSFGIRFKNYNVELRYLSLISSDSDDISSGSVFLSIGFYF